MVKRKLSKQLGTTKNIRNAFKAFTEDKKKTDNIGRKSHLSRSMSKMKFNLKTLASN